MKTVISILLILSFCGCTVEQNPVSAPTVEKVENLSLKQIGYNLDKTFNICISWEYSDSNHWRAIREFIIERKTDTRNWQEVIIIAGHLREWTDENMSLNYYTYRIRGKNHHGFSECTSDELKVDLRNVQIIY